MFHIKDIKVCLELAMLNVYFGISNIYSISADEYVDSTAVT